MARRTAAREGGSPGMRTSEFKLAWIIPTLATFLALLLEWAGKLPDWAKSPVVLVGAMVCATAIAVAYIVSRGLAKHEVRGAELEQPPPGGVERP